MHKIEKSTLFMELTVEQSAIVSGGDGTIDPVIELAQKLAQYGIDYNAKVNIVSNPNPTTGSSGNTSSASSSASGPLHGLTVVSGGNIQVPNF